MLGGEIGMQTTKAMEKVCRDFSIFCDYVLENRIKLSKTTGYISKIDCFELNKLISVKESYEKATRTQNQYPVIHFFYYVALKYRILEINYTKMFLHEGRNYKSFVKSSEIEKYVFLIVITINDMEFLEQNVCYKMDVGYLMNWLSEKCAHVDDEYQLPDNEFLWLTFDRIKISSILEELCLIKVMERPLCEKRRWQGTLKIKILPLFEMVAELYGSISKDNVAFWNRDVSDCLEIFLKALVPKYQESKIFCLLQQSKEVNLCQAVDLEVKVRYTDVKRVIRMNLSNTLYSLHKMIQEAVQFDDDHLFEFYVGMGMFKQTYSMSGGFNYRGEKYVEDTTLGELELYKGMKFSYLFDFGDMWWFDIKVLDILDFTVEKSEVIKEVNPAPEQYPQYDEEEYWE